MRSRLVIRIVLAVLAAGLSGPAQAEDDIKLAVFNFQLYDTSLEGEVRGPDPAEAERLLVITNILRDAYREHEGYTLVDTSNVDARLESMPALRTCNGCESRLARELGADRVVTGFVQKISTLILSLSISVHDAQSGELRTKFNASIRGNTDESWEHGMRYLIRNQIFEDR